MATFCPKILRFNLFSKVIKASISSFSTVFLGIWHIFEIISSILTSSINVLSSLFSIEIDAPASSITSIALSGKNLSFIYLLLKITALSIALSV